MQRKTETNKRLDEIEKILSAIDKTLAINTEHLAEHMRRTHNIEDELKSVVKHVEQMRGASKLLTLLALLATVVSAFVILR
jgi:hypothetical protein